jgi:hypothetical protein
MSQSIQRGERPEGGESSAQKLSSRTGSIPVRTIRSLGGILKFYLTVDQTSCLLCVGGRCNLKTVRAIQPLEHAHDKRDIDPPHRASAACRRRYKRHGFYLPSRNGGGVAPMPSFSSTRGLERPVADRRHFGRWMPLVRKFGVYAVIALVVPGGSLMAPFLWAFRRRQK